jgi:hypothetical protein
MAHNDIGRPAPVNSPAAGARRARFYMNGKWGIPCYAEFGSGMRVPKARRGVRDDMTSPDEVYWYKTAQRFLRQGRKDRALVIIGEFLRTSPEHPLTRSLLSEMYKEDDRPGGVVVERRKTAPRSIPRLLRAAGEGSPGSPPGAAVPKKTPAGPSTEATPPAPEIIENCEVVHRNHGLPVLE